MPACSVCGETVLDDALLDHWSSHFNLLKPRGPLWGAPESKKTVTGTGPGWPKGFKEAQAEVEKRVKGRVARLKRADREGYLDLQRAMAEDFEPPITRLGKFLDRISQADLSPEVHDAVRRAKAHLVELGDLNRLHNEHGGLKKDIGVARRELEFELGHVLILAERA